MTEGLVSVIVPNYNNGNLIRRCLQSILSQTYSNLEIIVVDDGSTDDSWKIINDIKKTDERVHAYRKENSGVSDTRNFGIKHANGQFIGFVDSDDYIDSTMYQKLVDLQIKYNGDISVIKEYGCGECLNEVIVFDIREAIIELNRSKYYSGHMMSKLFRSSLFEDVVFRKDIAICEDLLICHYLFNKAKKVIFYDKEYYHRTPNPKSAMRASFKDSFLTCRIASEEIIQFFLDNYPEEIGYAYHTLIDNDFSIINRVARTSLYEKSKKYRGLVEEIRQEILDNYDKCNPDLFSRREKNNIKKLRKGFMLYKAYFYLLLIKHRLSRK